MSQSASTYIVTMSVNHCLLSSRNVQHGQVLDWLLGPFRMRWQQPEWQQRFLSSPSGIVDLLSCRDKIFVGPAANDGKSYNEEIWFVYHTVTFFERALRRCAEPKKSKSPSLMVSHLQWMLPPLLKVSISWRSSMCTRNF